MTRNISLKISAFVLFALLCSVGVLVAAHKPLWIDELHTQYNTMQVVPVGEILWGKSTGEGNNAPLFYLMQKWTIIFPDTQVTWGQYQDAVLSDVHLQVFLRVFPILFMSGALSILFYFFAATFEIWSGAYALLCALASPMVWFYWAEARPYPLIFFLSVVQSIVLICLWRSPRTESRPWIGLAVVHVLLVLTSYLTLLQIFAASFLLFFLGERDWKRFFWWTVLPVLIGSFYRYQGDKVNYDPSFHWGFILDNLPFDRVVFLILGSLLLGLAAFFAKDRTWLGKDQVWPRYFLFMFLGALSVFFLFGALMIRFKPHEHLVDLDSRFFIFLTPVGIIAQVLLMRELVQKALKDRWILVTLGIMVVMLSAIAFMNVSTQVFTKLRYL